MRIEGGHKKGRGLKRCKKYITMGVCRKSKKNRGNSPNEKSIHGLIVNFQKGKVS